MKKRRLRISLGAIALMLCLLPVLWACSHTRQGLSSMEPRQAYSHAIRDAEVAEYNEISRNLVAIVPGNEVLIWSRDMQVLVVTWTSWDGYDDKVGGSTKLSKDLWVTVVPEVKAFCRDRNLAPEQLTLRIEQLLGLPTGDGKNRFVEIWVSPDDLFRPTPDPEISDHEAGLDFPLSCQFVTVRERYKKWFDDLKQSSYGAEG